MRVSVGEPEGEGLQLHSLQSRLFVRQRSTVVRGPLSSVDCIPAGASKVRARAFSVWLAMVGVHIALSL